MLALLACSSPHVKLGDTGDSAADSAAGSDTEGGSETGAETGGETGAETGGETGGDTGESGSDGGGPDVNPFITEVAEVRCQNDGGQGETWYVTVLCDDPQGADTVQIGTQTIYDADGAPIETYGLECYDGVCTSYFRAEYDGITCAMGPTILFEFKVQDIDFHWSEAWYHTPA